MKVLCGVVDYGMSKSYVRNQFWEMASECLLPIHGLDIVLATDMAAAGYLSPGGMPTINMGGGHVYVEDMLMEAREEMRFMALEQGYDKLMWQGIDALWQNRADVERVLSHEIDIVAPLISARSDSNHAVARRFRVSSHDHAYLEEQDDINPLELSSGQLVPAGFPGGDNIVIARDVLKDRSWIGEHTPWYERVAAGETNIECIEWFVRDALNGGFESYVDTRVKVWHVHESGAPDGGPMAHMWPGISVPLADLQW